MTEQITTESVLTRKQTKTFGPVPIGGYGVSGEIKATLRFDDECGNGHNSLSITASVTTSDSRRRNDSVAGGCMHEEIAKHFPYVARFIKWHLCSTDGPISYIANTVYHASDKDHNGLRKGEKRQLRNGRTKLPVWQRVARDADGIEVKLGSTDWRDSEEKPVETLTIDWEPVWTIGEGKERQLDYARRSAVWPDATDEELLADGLKERLEARLPQLLSDFRADVESLGFVW